MKINFLAAVFAAMVSAQSLATISGPSCSELTGFQQRLLKRAAISHVIKKHDRGEVKVDRASIIVENVDCHDYDGVHSATEFELTWDQTDADQEMECKKTVSVSVEHDSKKRTLIIDRRARFTVEEQSEVECQN